LLKVISHNIREKTYTGSYFWCWCGSPASC